MSLIQSRSVTNVDHCAPRGSSRNGDRFPYAHLSSSGFAISEPSAGRLELRYRSPHLPRPLRSRPFPRRNVPHDMKPPGVPFPRRLSSKLLDKIASYREEPRRWPARRMELTSFTLRFPTTNRRNLLSCLKVRRLGASISDMICGHRKSLGPHNPIRSPCNCVCVLIKKTPYKSELGSLRHGVFALTIYHSTYDRVGGSRRLFTRGRPTLTHYYSHAVNIKNILAVQLIQVGL